MTHIKRITPLRVVDDIDEASLFYEAVGASRLETDTPECVGFRAANDTGVILTSLKSAAGLYGPFVAQKIANHGALYFHVDNIDAQLAQFPSPTQVIARNTISGVEEAVVETKEGLVVLAMGIEPVNA